MASGFGGASRGFFVLPDKVGLERFAACRLGFKGFYGGKNFLHVFPYMLCAFPLKDFYDAGAAWGEHSAAYLQNLLREGLRAGGVHCAVARR